MHLLTWNIQCGKGCDGVTDLARIVSVAKEMADADASCVQIVIRRDHLLPFFGLVWGGGCRPP
jgi:endonuclease/exonuclease/phosphatase family metal-dependent hydrolase